MTNLEQIVRPFQTGELFSPFSQPTGRGRPAIEPVLVSIGKGGDAQTFSYSNHFHGESGDIQGGKFKEIKRTTKKVRVENPDDSEQFVEFKRVESVLLKNEKSDEKFKYTFNNSDTA